jgi:hypothetical protein
MKTNVSLKLRTTLKTHFGKIVFKSKIIRTNGYFDWYIGTKEIMYFFDFLKIEKNSRVLILGCGNSSKIKRTFRRVVGLRLWKCDKYRHFYRVFR